jgi:hypothetical protein
MSMDPRDLEGMSDDLRPIDRAMLLVLSHRQRDSTPLSLDQERLLDSWMAGDLPPIDADRAAERRLISAANEGPGVPTPLAARVLRASRPPTRRMGGIFNLQWPTLSGWQWSGLGAALAAIVVIAVFGFQFWQAQLRLEQSFQIAMVTIEDRSVLSEGARRTRGPSGEKPADSRYRDIDIPTALLRNAINSISAHRGNVERSELMNYLREHNVVFDNQAHILIDSALADSLSGIPDERNIKMLHADLRFILLTLKP